MILDLAAAAEAGLFAGASTRRGGSGLAGSLNDLFASGPSAATRVAGSAHPSFSMPRGRTVSALRQSAVAFCDARQTASCIFRRGSATTPTSMSAFTTPPMSGRSSGPTIRSCRTTSTYRSAITVAHHRSCLPARRCGIPSGQLKDADTSDADLRSQPTSRLRTGTRHLDRARQRAR